MSRNDDLFARAQRTIPAGVNSPVRAFRSVGGTPRFLVRGAGPYVWDADGTRYIDYVGSWGPAIVGFGSRPLKYSTGRELEWPIAAFSPRKNALTLYLSLYGYDKYEEYLSKLGKHTTGKSCLYIKRLSDVDKKVLTNLIKASVEHARNRR
jgi:4-aminobutyrate aminotransferase-like enzyme